MAEITQSIQETISYRAAGGLRRRGVSAYRDCRAWCVLGLFVACVVLAGCGRRIGDEHAEILAFDAAAERTAPSGHDAWSEVTRAVIHHDNGIQPAVAVTPVSHQDGSVAACQALSPAAPNPINGVDCVYGYCGDCGELGWKAATSIDWQYYAQGEYVGAARTPHVWEYRLRVDDLLDIVYRVTRNEQKTPYLLNVGDEIRVESFADPALSRDLIIQPDGSITLRLLGQVRAAEHTVAQLTEKLDDLYAKYYREPSITVTPLRVNTRLEDLRASVDSRFGAGGQSRQARVTPEGTIALPMIGTVPAQGLTLPELDFELNALYAADIDGIEVTAVLVDRAPRFVYVLGEVGSPGRFTLDGPTTVMQSIAMAGGWNVGANLRQVVVFRRGHDWHLMATMLDIRGALYAKMPCPADEIWIADSDIVLVPKAPIKVANDVIEQVFTRGLYGVVPFNTGVNFDVLNRL